MTTILKCKMCGGTLEIKENETVARCKYCGSLMTLPNVDTEKKARLFNRANEYRLNNEFDKAFDAYKAIVEEDPTEAEAYWGMILSEYGIEYVEDPKTGKRIPTCHRTQTKLVQNSVNYQMTLKYADSERRMVYQDEAEELDRLQRDIFAVSYKEDPYDVFISYKETEESTGERTEDSVIAEQIYNELIRLGFRVFFSRVTLEEHLGENYEPYIYGALSSSKVLIAVATSTYHLESTWVKNEWMRFLHMMDDDKTKMIIPVFKNMSPYELPPILSPYQAMDMSKIGAVQELGRGVQRILGKKEISEKEALLNRLLEKERKEEELRKKEAERRQKQQDAIKKQETLKTEESAVPKSKTKLISVFMGSVFLVVALVIGSNFINKSKTSNTQEVSNENTQEVSEQTQTYARPTSIKDASKPPASAGDTIVIPVSSVNVFDSEFNKKIATLKKGDKVVVSSCFVRDASYVISYEIENGVYGYFYYDNKEWSR